MLLKQKLSLLFLSKKETTKSQKQFVSWNQLSSILIIAFDNQLSDIVDFINLCKQDKISVHVAVIYNGKIENAPNPHFEHTLIDRKQFSFFQMPHETVLQKLNAKHPDVLINLANYEQIQALALSKLVSAKCKISHFQNPIFDININFDKTLNSSYYLKQVVVYLNMIKTSK